MEDMFTHQDHRMRQPAGVADGEIQKEGADQECCRGVQKGLTVHRYLYFPAALLSRASSKTISRSDVVKIAAADRRSSVMEFALRRCARSCSMLAPIRFSQQNMPPGRSVRR